MVVLVLCLVASIAIGGYKLMTTPVEVFTPTSDAWGTLEWPERPRGGEGGGS